VLGSIETTAIGEFGRNDHREDATHFSEYFVGKIDMEAVGFEMIGFE
jgi:hypothetical protein